MNSRWARLVLSLALLAPASAAPIAVASALNGQGCRRTDNVVARTDGWTSIRPPAALASLLGAAPDPLAVGRIYAYNATTVDRSDDGGCSWRTVFNAPATTTVRQPVVRSRITGVAVGAGVWVTTATTTARTTANVGASAVWRSATGTGSFGYAGAGIPIGGTVLQLVPTERAGIAYALVETLAGPRLYASSEPAGGAVTWQSRTVPNFITLSSIAVDPLVPDIVDVASPYAYARSSDGGVTFPVERRVPGRITAIDAARNALDVYLASGRLLTVEAGTRSIPAPAGVDGATHVLVEPGVRAVSTSYGDFGYDPFRQKWLPITPLGLVVQHLQMATPTLPPVLYGTAGRLIFELPLHFPAAFAIRAPGGQPGSAIPIHGVGGFGSHPPTFAPAARTLRLPVGATRRAHYVLRVPARPGPLDVEFLVDTTNSMLPAISGLRRGMQQIIAALGRTTPNLEVGLADFRDFDDGEAVTLVSGQQIGNGLLHKHHLYVLDQRIAPVGPGLGAALGRLKAAGGGDVPEADTIAVMQSLTGTGLPNWIPPGQEAGFRPNATKVIVLITDSPMHLHPPYPSLTATVDALRAYDVKLVGVDINDGLAKAVTDLRALAAGSGTLAPPGGVTCDAHGHAHVPAGAPMVCSVPVTGAGIAQLAGPVSRLIEEVDAAGSLSVQLHSANPSVARFAGPSHKVVNLHRNTRLPVTVAYRCPLSEAGQQVPITLNGLVAGTPVAHTSVTLSCVAPPVAAAVPPAAVVAAVVAAPPPPPPPVTTSNVNPNVNPGTGAATQEEQQSQLAVADLGDQPDSAPAVSDNGPDMGAPMLYAAALLLTGAAALALRLRPQPQLSRVRASSPTRPRRGAR